MREAAGLSLSALAGRSGVSVSVLSDLERGKGGAENEVLSALANLYDMSVETLLEWCPLTPGLQELLTRPGVNIPAGRILRLCLLEFRGGQGLSADDWARLSKQLETDECR